jgi:predicted metal-dependent hydrolase
MAYTIIRSKRKTLAIQITRELEIIVRSPQRLAKREIDRFVQAHQDWIDAHLQKQAAYRDTHPAPTQEDLAALRKQALQEIPPRVEHFAGVMGLSPTGIKITSAKTRFGSCSPVNSLCFSCRLMAYPSEAIDYVVVHELAHIVHKNHGKAFYALVGSILPDYKARKALLRR